MKILNAGAAASLVKLWNKYMSIDDVLARSKKTPGDQVKAYLESRKGYPGPIVVAGRTRVSNVIPREERARRDSPSRSPVTLARVRFLEGAE